MASPLLEQSIECRRASADRAKLCVQREDIHFGNVAPDRIRIRVTVWNHADVWSRPTSMVLEAAPLGAFVPWRDLASAMVPAIAPHQSADVTTELSMQPQRLVLGDFSSVPPDRLLTALASDDEPEQRSTMADITRMRRLVLQRSRVATWPPDLMQLLGRGNPHWAGNLNVHLGGQPVERHMARALRIYPGRTNLAMFVVGDQPDEYQFSFSGSGFGWELGLFNQTGRLSLCSGLSDPIPMTTWIPLSTTAMFILAMCPPADCASGSVNVHVVQRSTNKEALVEFSLDARAAGAGCYTIG